MTSYSNGGLHVLAWIIIILIFIGISMLVHYETAARDRMNEALSEAKLARNAIHQDAAELKSSLNLLADRFMAEHHKTQELVVEAAALRAAISDCGRIRFAKDK